MAGDKNPSNFISNMTFPRQDWDVTFCPLGQVEGLHLGHYLVATSRSVVMLSMKDVLPYSQCQSWSTSNIPCPLL